MMRLDKVLISTKHLANWGGSELVSIELAEEFVRRGVAVTIVASHVCENLVASLSEIGITVETDVDTIDLGSYDLAYCQHHMFSLVLASALRRGMALEQLPVLVWNHLSPYEPSEFPGPVVEEALVDLVMANSEETAAFIATFGARFGAAKIFANPAPRSFAEVTSQPAAKLTNLLVISNHLPPEVQEVLRRLERSAITATHIGLKGRAERITPQHMAKCDAVLTIGKSVQYAMRAGRPVFCYDRFQGPGWLSCDDSVAAAAAVNFSGRDRRTPRSACEIERALSDGYAEARDFAQRLRQAVPEDYRLEAQVDLLLDHADAAQADPARTARLEALGRDSAFLSGLHREAALVGLVLRESLAARKYKERSRRRISTRAPRLLDLTQRIFSREPQST